MPAAIGWLVRAAAGLALLALGAWAVHDSWPLRRVHHDAYRYTADEAEALRRYPDAQFAFGMQAWEAQQLEAAADFFRRALARNVLYIDAWIRLAETQAALGRTAEARAMLDFTIGLAEGGWRWKWSQLVLARELGMAAFFRRTANDLLSHELWDQDTLQLLHTHFDGDAAAVIEALDAPHLPAYLDWLMRWGMTEESLAVWQAMNTSAAPQRDLSLRYAHFLLSRERVVESAAIWRAVTHTDGLTNPGFESELSGQGFDWRYWGADEGFWELKRVHTERAEGDASLRITFGGRQNIDFLHLYQIVPLTPTRQYRLVYRWKSRGITTDQGPFVEIINYGGQVLYQSGSMMTGTHDWREEAIAFSVPADCHAGVVRLRRRASMRFDAKIQGSLWLDDFRLEITRATAADADTTPRKRTHRFIGQVVGHPATTR